MMLEPPLAPMEARSVEELPEGAQWQFEPRWDGFRCLAFRTDDEVYLQSKAQQPLGRYFPEIVEALGGMRARLCVLDGELAVPAGEGFSFDALLQRVHPAASRVTRLSRETPAIFVVFDLLADARGRSLLERSLRERRAALEAFAESQFANDRLRPARSAPERRAAIACSVPRVTSTSKAPSAIAAKSSSPARAARKARAAK